MSGMRASGFSLHEVIPPAARATGREPCASRFCNPPESGRLHSLRKQQSVESIAVRGVRRRDGLTISIPRICGVERRPAPPKIFENLLAGGLGVRAVFRPTRLDPPPAFRLGSRRSSLESAAFTRRSSPPRGEGDAVHRSHPGEGAECNEAGGAWRHFRSKLSSGSRKASIRDDTAAAKPTPRSGSTGRGPARNACRGGREAERLRAARSSSRMSA